MINIFFLSKKRSEVFKLIKDNNSNRAVAQIKYFLNKVEEGKKLIKDAEKEVEQAYEEYYQHDKEAKGNLKSDISDVVKYTSYELNEQKQEVYENHTKAIEREKKKREKARFQKLLAFSEGVALASIDGIAPQYIQAAQEIGNQVMKASNDIVEQLKEQLSIFGVYNALSSLENQGYITEAVTTIPKEEAAFWSSRELNPTSTNNRLQTTKVSVTSFGFPKAESLISALASLNIQVDAVGVPSEQLNVYIFWETKKSTSLVENVAYHF